MLTTASRRRGRHRRSRGDWYRELLWPGTVEAVRVQQLQRQRDRERRYAHQTRHVRVIPRQPAARRAALTAASP